MSHVFNTSSRWHFPFLLKYTHPLTVGLLNQLVLMQSFHAQQNERFEQLSPVAWHSPAAIVALCSAIERSSNASLREYWGGEAVVEVMF